jgi:acyl-CoA reductase-like NAD-dependent aldehyde dehydrogenase
MTDLSAPPAEALSIHSPADGRFVGWLPAASHQEVASALDAARAVAPVWGRRAPAERATLLHLAASDLREQVDELADTVVAETGRSPVSAREGIEAGASTLDQYAELGPVRGGRSLLGASDATDFMIPEPRGVVVALTPWNDPVAVACGLLGAALVTGNVVIHKPSERCPHLGMQLGQVLGEHFPEGVLQTLLGDGRVGALLGGDHRVDVVAHVGSTATGRSIAAATARTGAKALLENGGNDPVVIDSDVDPAWAAEQTAVGAFTNAGQMCTSVERVYVHRAVADEFLYALCSQARRWNADPQPLVDTRQREHVHSQVLEAAEAGAELLVGGRLPDRDGAYYPATVLTGCTPGMRVMREETFGPVAAVRVVDDFDQALAEACDDAYGLAATVLTGSMAHAQQAWRALQVGTVKVNAVFGGAPGGAAQPRRASGTGFGYGPELLDEMTTIKVVHLEPAPPRR